jgi:hypothetical protein
MSPEEATRMRKERISGPLGRLGTLRQELQIKTLRPAERSHVSSAAPARAT